MSQLSAQSIKMLCQSSRFFGLVKQEPMITPFEETKMIVNGKSYGLSSASYDVRIAHDLTLGPNPSLLLAKMCKGIDYRGYRTEHLMEAWRDRITSLPPSYALAHTIEDFVMPNNVVGYVCDKSTYARVFVSAFNTLFDPGFRGNATLELVNLGAETVTYKKGDPVCQFAFEWLDKKTDRPYRGKYQNQTKEAHGARYE